MIMLVNGGYTQLHQSGYMSVSGRYVLIVGMFCVCALEGAGAVICLCLLVFEHALCLCVCVCARVHAQIHAFIQMGSH